MRTAEAAEAQRIDAEAERDWGLDPYALVEAAGRACAQALVRAFPSRFASPGPRIAIAAGSGNNGADALVLLRALILSERIDSRNSLVVTAKAEAPRRTPRTEALKAAVALGVPSLIWDGRGGAAEAALASMDLLVDGIAGTGLSGALSGPHAELLDALRRLRALKPGSLLVAVDLPSGLHDGWETGMPLLGVDATLAVEPRKAALYGGAGRTAAGILLPVEGIFPRALLETASGPELVCLGEAAAHIPTVRRDDYKHRRGVVEIHAGSPGCAGAARLASLGAQAAGGGLIRLLTDGDTAAALSGVSSGVMVDEESRGGSSGRFAPDALLLGPGWLRSADREQLVGNAWERERLGGPALVLDADALFYAGKLCFSGRTIMTPHPGEFAELAAAALVPAPRGADYRAEVLSRPIPLLQETARRTGAVILLKGHVLLAAAPDGRIGIVDGMEPVLAMGGSGDLLAGMAAALAGRASRVDPAWDAYRVALCAAALLVEAGRAAAERCGFCDPADVAEEVGRIAGRLWLPSGSLPSGGQHG